MFVYVVWAASPPTQHTHPSAFTDVERQKTLEADAFLDTPGVAMLSEINKLEIELQLLKSIRESLHNIQEAQQVVDVIHSEKENELLRLKQENISGIFVTNPTSRRDVNVATYQTINNQILEENYKEQISEVYRLVETDFYLALRKFDQLLMSSNKLDDNDKIRFIDYVKSVFWGMKQSRNFIRNLGNHLVDGDTSEEDVCKLLKKYDFDYLYNLLFGDKEEINDVFIVELFKKYQDSARDFCVYMIKKHVIKIEERKDIDRNYIIFSDHRILSRYRNILHYLSQSNINNLNCLIEYSENSLLDDITHINLLERNTLLNIFNGLRNLGFTASDELRTSRHIAIAESLICLNSFKKNICALQISAEQRSWSVCLMNDTLSSIRHEKLTRRSVLEDIIKSIADAWLDLLADKPMALFALHPDIQNELGRLLRWHVPSLGSLAIELYSRGNTSLVPFYEDFQHLFTTSYAIAHSTPSDQELLIWLKLRPDICMQTWLWVIQYPPNPQYLDILIQLMPHLERTNTWMRLVLAEQNSIPPSFYWIEESQENWEERFQHFFKLFANDAFANQFSRARGEIEAKQALIHLFYRSNGSFKQSIRIFLEIYNATMQRSTEKRGGRLKTSDFEV